MTRTLQETRLGRQDPRTGGFTRLERTVMQALARELRGEVPDLAAQFVASRLTVRRNSGFGLFTEMLVPPERPTSGPSGEFGTVHAMIAGLADPVAFRARLRNGRLLGLLGDSYGQDTRSIDFASAAFNQVFTLDSAGRSVPTELPAEGGRAAPSHPSRPDAATPAQTPPPAIVQLRPDGADAARQHPAPPAEPAPSADADGQPGSEDRTSLRVGLWTGLFALGSILVLVFDVPIPFVFVAAFVAGRFFQTDRGLDLLRQAKASLQRGAPEGQA